MPSLIQFRRDNTPAWDAANTVLADGELGWERTLRKFKVGDGTSTWSELPYSGLDGDSAYDEWVAAGNSGSEEDFLASLVGPEGQAGADGPEGPEGPAGQAGLPGAQGIPGVDGAAGPKGDQGDQGPPGQDGADGAPGAAGVVGPPGPKGDPGDPGPAGSNGIDGAPGPQGGEGPEGPAGPQGLPGSNGLPGATGPVGPEGAQGPAGPPGPGGEPLIAQALNTDRVTNINTSALTDVPLVGTTATVDGGYLDAGFSEAVGIYAGLGIECEFTGRVKGTVSVRFSAVSIRTALIGRFAINGTAVGPTFDLSYARVSNGHNTSGNFGSSWLSVQTGDVVTFQCRRHAGGPTGVATLEGTHESMLLLERWAA